MVGGVGSGIMSDQDEKSQETDSSQEAELALAREKLWVRSGVCVLVVFIFVWGGSLVFRSCTSIPGVVSEGVIGSAASILSDVAAAFRTQNVTTSFISYGTKMRSMRRLQFGSVEQTELFTRTHTGTFAYITLPEVVVEARAPIQYTYFVDLEKKWHFELADGRVKAWVPAIEFNQPAVDVSRVVYEVKRGAFGTEEVLEDLKKSITYMSRAKARDNMHLVRESGRKQIEAFVQEWLGWSFSDGKEYPVEVIFADEEPRLQGTGETTE